MTPNLKLQEAIDLVKQEYELHYNAYKDEQMTKGFKKIRNAMKDVISAAQSIIAKGVDFPYCAKNCEVIKELGAGECESVCPIKFSKPSGEAKQMTVEELYRVIKKAWHELYNAPVEGEISINVEKIERHLATALFEAVYGSDK